MVRCRLIFVRGYKWRYLQCFQHPNTKEYIAHRGDYIWGRLLPGFWQLSKGMYKKSALGFLGIFLGIPGYILFLNTILGGSFNIDAATIMSIVLLLISLSIIIGLANSSALDYKRHLLGKGYIQKTNGYLRAENEGEAIEKYTSGKNV